MPDEPRPPGEGLWRRLTEAQNVALAAEELARPDNPDSLDHPDGRVRAARIGAPSFGRPVRRVSPGRLAGAVAAVAVAAAALFLLIPRQPAGRLRVQVGSAAEEAVAAVPSLVADAQADLPLRFSDGSAVTFRAGSAGRLESLTASGSEIVLERGALTAHVVHALTTAWVVRAGPYRVRVTGTRFAVSWRAGRLDLSLFEGSVIVDGSVLGAGVPLTAGRRLTVASGVVRIEPFQAAGPPPRVAQQGRGQNDRLNDQRDGAPAPSARSTDTGEEAPRDEAPSPGGSKALALGDGPRARDALSRLAGEPGSSGAFMTDEPRSATSPTSPTSREGASEDTTGASRPGHPRSPRPGVRAARAGDESWLALAEDRHYSEALAAARRLGWSNLCRHLDAHRLLTLADVARYSGARAPARRAFESLARRFPHDRLAGDAVFSLGRMAFEAGHPAEAARWFRRYGADWPNGPLADEAAGRLVESAIRLQDTKAARAAAHAYLARAPHGAQASLARGVLTDSTDGAP